MKNLVAMSAMLALLAGAASAASNQTNERPDTRTAPVVAAQTVQVKASSIYSTKELARAGLTANATVEVTAVPSNGMMDMRRRDN